MSQVSNLDCVFWITFYNLIWVSVGSCFLWVVYICILSYCISRFQIFFQSVNPFFRYQIDSTKVQSNDMTHFNDPIELVYYDQLANQIDPIFLTIRKQESWDLSSMMNDSKELISPIEHCIKTQWSDSIVDWNGSEPLL